MILKDDPIMQAKIFNDDDFINSKKNDYSIKKFLETHPNGTNDALIALFLNITPKELEKIFNEAIEMYRLLLEIDVE